MPYSDDEVIPAIGAIPQTERMFRVSWRANLDHSPSGVPLLPADYVAKAGRNVHVIDVRSEEEILGPLGYIPGAEWVPRGELDGVLDRLGPFTPVVLVSRGGERASEEALELSQSGMKLVAAMRGGIVAWRDLGYSTTRDPSILERRDVLWTPPTPAAESEACTVDHVRTHLGAPGSVRFLKLAALAVHGHFSCVDGRDDGGVIGTPGGDAGELLVGLRALEMTRGKELTREEVRALFARHVDAFGRFYMHTDVAAANKSIATLRADRRFDEALQDVDSPLSWRRFWASPPEGLRDTLAAHAVMPAHVGCGHLRLSLTEPERYQTRAGLVSDFIETFMRERWSGAREAEFVPLAGAHGERAVLNVRVSGKLQPYTHIPLVSPSVGGFQVFVQHPRVTAWYRAQIAALIASQTDLVGRVDEDRLHEQMQALASHQLRRTLTTLAKGLPIYDVTFEDERTVDVRFAGHVED
ncbi:MAG: rhodanese-like domain-containing protein [Myxococcales bacterium]|nr:rhodanese-like domain-containing protein [Myxococcales bacterium]